MQLLYSLYLFFINSRFQFFLQCAIKIFQNSTEYIFWLCIIKLISVHSRSIINSRPNGFPSLCIINIKPNIHQDCRKIATTNIIGLLASCSYSNRTVRCINRILSGHRKSICISIRILRANSIVFKLYINYNIKIIFNITFPLFICVYRKFR